MRFRDKETGEIEEVCLAMSGDRIAVISADMPLCGNSILGEYDSLAELTDKWEDYKPIEPLIKDEKIRKAVRAWAKANEAFWASTYKSCSDGNYWYIRAFNDTERGIDIDFWGELPKELIDCKCYTIAELCGEEAPEPIEPTFVDLDERIKEKEEK